MGAFCPCNPSAPLYGAYGVCEFCAAERRLASGATIADIDALARVKADFSFYFSAGRLHVERAARVGGV